MSSDHPFVETELDCSGTARNLDCNVTSPHYSMSRPRFFLGLLLFWLRWVFIGVHRLSPVTVCGLRFPTSREILDPGPAIKHASPASEGGFFTTKPPGSPSKC